MEPSTLQLSVPLPRSIDTRIYIRLTIRLKSVLLFLTTAAPDELAAPVAMGSFVYAVPNVRLPHPPVPSLCLLPCQRLNPGQPLSTALYSTESSVEFTSRMAVLISRKTQLPVYVGNSMSFASAGMGGTVEEEMEAFKKVVDITLRELQHVIKAPDTATNGVLGHST
jgi:hypothetical protein